jgi:hypothetical protein
MASAGGSRIAFVRRPVIDLPLMPPPDGDSSADALPSPGAEFEPVSPLDVPAFLRRQSES